MASFRERVGNVMRETQDSICEALEAVERERGSKASFREDVWERAGGGGGRTRVLVNGAFLEKAGVNVSAVHGQLNPEFAKQIPGSGGAFFATGVSLVLHPKSPHVPTVHANFRYIVHGEKSWFGGGSDLTPYYFHAEDKEHFHRVWKSLCEQHADIANYPRFRDWCDRYFYLPHRGERRGVGGIFFDHLLTDGDAARSEKLLAFVRAAGAAFPGAYLPIVRKHLDERVTRAQRTWQELRRGRYVEFNLLHDRGTVFGLKTGGRTESILMSLPPCVRWSYAHEPRKGSAEAALLQELRRPPPPE
ncbi:MAG: oxygen-dependent coproporphyrinogen oxidase [Planctomycetota bacterium]|jgi:coproporphyrinogen III oxidase|nr:oxygen-dependent coproporphyrinogen oxidase [Planctomycetota bacterium]